MQSDNHQGRRRLAGGFRAGSRRDRLGPSDSRRAPHWRASGPRNASCRRTIRFRSTSAAVHPSLALSYRSNSSARHEAVLGTRTPSPSYPGATPARARITPLPSAGRDIGRKLDAADTSATRPQDCRKMRALALHSRSSPSPRGRCPLHRAACRSEAAPRPPPVGAVIVGARHEIEPQRLEICRNVRRRDQPIAARLRLGSPMVAVPVDGRPLKIAIAHIS